MTPRVFLGLTEVAGYFGSLRRGFEEAGIPAIFVDESGDPFSYGLAIRPFPALNRAVLGVHRQLAQPRTGSTRRLALRVAAALLRPVNLGYRLSLLAWAAWRCDVFIFGGEHSFLPGHRDLWLLKRLGKRVIWIFTGSDHRPPYLNGRLVHQARARGGMAWLAALTGRMSARIAAIERQAVVIGHAASAQLHWQPFVDVQEIGLPVWRAFPPLPPDGADGAPVRVLHSPSDPESKGSPAIRAVIARLQARGLPIDYREIAGRPNGEVLAAIADSDIVVDELYGDAPMGVLACEAAHLGRPTIVGGYFAAHLDQVAPEARPPTAYVLPDALEETLAALVADADARRRLGRDARTFVERRWALAEIARRLMAVADGRAPAEWLVDPATLTYVHGWGMGEDELATTLTAFIRSEGQAALHLEHSPQLTERLISLAERMEGRQGAPDGDRGSG